MSGVNYFNLILAKMTNKETLSILLRQLCNMTNEANSKDEAIEKGLDSYLMLDNYPMYGGYNLIRVAVVGGGHNTSFNSFSSAGYRVTAKVMIEKMRSFMAGIGFNSK